MFETGNKQFLLLRNLQTLGEAEVTCDFSDLPALPGLVPELSYLSWTVTLHSGADRAEVPAVFEFVEGLCHLAVRTAREPEAAPADIPATPPEPPLADLPPPSPAAPPPDAPDGDRPLQPEAPPAAATEPTARAPAPAPAKSVVRADLDRIEPLVNHVSELVINLRHRLRCLGLPDHKSHCAFVASEEGRAERPHLISALTTNLSHFFREAHHFDLLRNEVLPRLLPRLRGGGRMRIWSAGCSRGQEALSAAIELLEADPELAQLDLRILATDIDRDVVDFARAGTYPARMITGLPEPLRDKYFEPISEKGQISNASTPVPRRML